MKKILFLVVIFNIAACWADTDGTDFSAELSDLLVEHAKQTQKPSVLSSGFIKSYISGNVEATWVDIDGIDVAIKSSEDQQEIVTRAKDNYSTYRNVSKVHETSNTKLKLDGSSLEINLIIPQFEEECEINIKRKFSHQIELSFITPKPIPLLSACQFLVYTFSVNGVDLMLEDNQLVAVER